GRASVHQAAPDPVGRRRALAGGPRRSTPHPRRRGLPLLLHARLRGTARERDHQPRDHRQQPLLYRRRGRCAGRDPALGGSQADQGSAGVPGQAPRRDVTEHFPAEIPVNLTGTLVLLTGTASDIVAGQIKSLTLALGIIFLVMTAMFLSAKIGFFAILPNVVPIVIFFGVMGWLGIYLNLGTSLIAAIALGIAVDSTIHYMARLNLELRGETDQAAAIVRTLRTVGVPIVYTTIALFFGFLTFTLSSFVPIQNFGILAGVTMATALGANLVLLPALLATTKIITLWDLLGVKLGDDPARTIPLFAGLRPSQARIVVLMG